jgi:hypothetical protein
MEQLVEAGNFPRTAAIATGASEAGFSTWQRTGRQYLAEHPELLDDEVSPTINSGDDLDRRCGIFILRLTRAREKAQARAVTIISLAMEKDWRAAAFYLERGFAEEWGQKTKQTTTLQGNPEAPIEVGDAVELLKARLDAIRLRRAEAVEHSPQALLPEPSE